MFLVEDAAAELQGAFERAVAGAKDAPRDTKTRNALARQLYLGHLGVLLLWSMDQSPQQRAMWELVELVESSASWLRMAFALPFVRKAMRSADASFVAALFELNGST